MTYWIPLIAFALFIVDWRITRDNMNVPWNGFGCVRNVIKGTAQLPMQYRVLVPWLTVLLGFGEVYRWAYMTVKYLGMLVMLYGFHWYLGQLGVDADLGTAILAGIVPLTMQYDYADAYWEIGLLAIGIGLILGGESIWLLMLITFMACLNRETSAVILAALAVLYLGLTMRFGFISLLVGASVLLPRLLYGKKTRYCHWNLIPRNLKEIRQHPSLLNGYTHTVVLLAAFAITSIAGLMPNNFLPVVISVALVSVALLIPSMWNEPRVFLPTLLVTIPMGIR